MPRPVLAFPKEEMPRSGDPGLGLTLFQAPAASGALQAEQGGIFPVGRLWSVSRRGCIGCCAITCAGMEGVGEGIWRAERPAPKDP